MSNGAVHSRFKRCLQRAGLPATVKLHEMRNSAGDAIWRASKDIVMAQELLRHESRSTTANYLHPDRDDLAATTRRI